jgi:hypothetical protein
MELLRAEAEAKKKEGSAADRRREQAAILEKVFNPAASSAQGARGGQGGQAAQGAPAQPQPPASSPGMKVVPPGDSQTGQTEVIIDAFPAGRPPRGK